MWCLASTTPANLVLLSHAQTWLATKPVGCRCCGRVCAGSALVLLWLLFGVCWPWSCLHDTSDPCPLDILCAHKRHWPHVTVRCARALLPTRSLLLAEEEHTPPYSWSADCNPLGASCPMPCSRTRSCTHVLCPASALAMHASGACATTCQCCCVQPIVASSWCV